MSENMEEKLARLREKSEAAQRDLDGLDKARKRAREANGEVAKLCLEIVEKAALDARNACKLALATADSDSSVWYRDAAIFWEGVCEKVEEGY